MANAGWFVPSESCSKPRKIPEPDRDSTTPSRSGTTRSATEVTRSLPGSGSGKPPLLPLRTGGLPWAAPHQLGPPYLGIMPPRRTSPPKIPSAESQSPQHTQQAAGRRLLRQDSTISSLGGSDLSALAYSDTESLLELMLQKDTEMDSLRKELADTSKELAGYRKRFGMLVLEGKNQELSALSLSGEQKVDRSNRKPTPTCSARRSATPRRPSSASAPSAPRNSQPNANGLPNPSRRTILDAEPPTPEVTRLLWGTGIGDAERGSFACTPEDRSCSLQVDHCLPAEDVHDHAFARKTSTIASKPTSTTSTTCDQTNTTTFVVVPNGDEDQQTPGSKIQAAPAALSQHLPHQHRCEVYAQAG